MGDFLLLSSSRFISFSSWALYVASCGVIIYGHAINGVGVLFSMLFICIGLANMFFIKKSHDLVYGFYTSGDWRKENAAYIDPARFMRNPPFRPIVLLGLVVLIEGYFLLIFCAFLIWLGLSFGHIPRPMFFIFLSGVLFGGAIVHYTYWCFRAILFIQKHRPKTTTGSSETILDDQMTIKEMD